MAMRIRDTDAIGNYGQYLINQSELLGMAHTKLTNDINSIRNSYTGVDAEVQISVYTEAADKIKNMQNNFDYYGYYMKNLSKYDEDNIDNTKKQFDKLLADFNPKLFADINNSSDATFNTSNINVDILNNVDVLNTNGGVKNV